jgi:hypothetical protein
MNLLQRYSTLTRTTGCSPIFNQITNIYGKRGCPIFGQVVTR